MKTKLLMFTALAVTLTSASGAAAQLPPEARAGLWKAQWITSPSAPQRDIVVLHFRKAIEIPRVPEHFVVHVSADSQFILSVNQREVGRGPARSDLAHWKYETYDLAALLRPGRNDIAATVWSLGVSTGAQISDRTAFVLRGDSTEASVADTNTTWEVEEDKGVQVLPTPPDIQRSYYVAEPADQIDGALFDWSWNDAASSRGKWEKAAPIGNASERGVVLQNNNWQLMPNLLPAMQMEPTPVGRVVRASGTELPANFPGAGFEIPAHASVSLLLDQSHLTTAYPELTVSGGAKSRIRLTYAEAPVPDTEVFDLIRAESRKAGIAQRQFSDEEIVERSFLGMINEGARALEEGCALRASDIGIIYINGYGFPAWRGGPMFYADCLGLPHVVARLGGLERELGSRWRVAPLLRELAESASSFREFDKSRQV